MLESLKHRTHMGCQLWHGPKLPILVFYFLPEILGSTELSKWNLFRRNLRKSSFSSSAGHIVGTFYCCLTLSFHVPVLARPRGTKRNWSVNLPTRIHRVCCNLWLLPIHCDAGNDQEASDSQKSRTNSLNQGEARFRRMVRASAVSAGQHMRTSPKTYLDCQKWVCMYWQVGF